MSKEPFAEEIASKLRCAESLVGIDHRPAGNRRGVEQLVQPQPRRLLMSGY
ncbi:MAG: hypothetical protein JWR80_6533 [Bradyrhizobium sp.]|nr:hypothetical protein [Bradyrhizobium sp.]